MKTSSLRTNCSAFVSSALLLIVLCLSQTVEVKAQQWTTPDANQNINNTNTGNVGIGHTAPKYKFDIVGNPDNAQFRFGMDSSDSGGFLFSTGPAHAAFAAGASWGNGGWTARSMNASSINLSNGALNFFTNSGLSSGNPFTPTARMTIASSGYVGIGTTTPSYQFEVYNNLNGVAKIGFNNPSTGASAHAAFTFFEGSTEKAKIGVHGSGASSYVGGANAFTVWNFLNAPIVFGTNSAERMRIDQIGRVGIGTGSPARLVSVFATANPVVQLTDNTTGTTASDGFQIVQAGLNTVLENQEAGTMSFRTTATDRVTITAGGIVGINTSSPGAAYKLDVNGQINSSGFCLLGECKTTWSQIGSQWSTSGTTINYGGGNVGIGTATPQDLLHVYTTSGLGAIRFQGGATKAAFAGMWEPGQLFVLSNNRNPTTGNNFSTGTTGAQISLGGTGTTGDIAFSTTASGTIGTPTELMRIAANGKVGIGTTTPLQKLQIGTNTSTATSTPDAFSLGATYSNTAGTNAKLRLYDNGVGDIYGLGISFQQFDFIVPSVGSYVWYTGGAEKMRLHSNGTLGIGTSNPGASHKLDVNGSINSSGLCLAGECKTLWSQVGGSQWANGASSSINYGSGFVGVGVTSPTTKLDVAGTVNATGFTVAGSTLVSSQWANGSGTINYAGGNVGIGTASPTEKLHVTGNLKVSGDIEGGVIKAKYQDVAEWVDSSQELQAGTVVVLDTTKNNHVIASTQSYDSRIAGVISAQPGIALGERGEGRLLVATTGRVKVKVDATKGPIQIGDLLVTSDQEGFAMKSTPVEVAGVRIHRPGTLIGKALEPLASGKGEILVLLSLQ